MLEQRLSALSGKLEKIPATPVPESSASRLRVTAKGVRALRERLGLSAERFGRLIGVTAQSIYNWERQVTTPRGAQLTMLAGLRGIGKREAAARLMTIETGRAKKPA